MATHQQQELDSSNNAFGELVAALRTVQDLSRNDLANHVQRVVGVDDPLFDKATEQWVRRIEEGRRKHLTYHTVDALCRALDCTSQQRARMFLYAGCSVFDACDNKRDDVMELLSNVMLLLSETQHTMLDLAIEKHQNREQRKQRQITEQEQCEIVHSAIELLIVQLRGRSKSEGQAR